MSESRRQLSKFAATFAGGTMISRVLGLARDIVIAALIPPVSRDAYIVAFRFPNMLRDLVGEGASNAAFIPVLSESLEKDGDAAFRELTSAIMSAALVLLGVISLLGVVFMPLIFHLMPALEFVTGKRTVSQEEVDLMESLTRWIFPYIFFIGMTVFAMGPLFIMKHYATPSWSPALLNVCLIAACFLLRDRFPDPAYALVVGVWLGGLAQLLVQYVALAKYTGVWIPNFHLRHPGIWVAGGLLVPVLLGQAAGEVNKLVDSLFAASLGDSSVTALFYANRLIQLPLSIFGLAISAAILPSISRAAARKDFAEVRETLEHGLRQSYFLICPALVTLILMAEPIVSLLFQRGHFDETDTAQTAAAVVFYAGGLLFFAWVKVAVAGFYAIKNTRTPVIVASLSMLLNIVLCFALVRPMGFRGLALATTVSYSVNFLLLYILLGRRFGPLWDREFLSVLFRVTVSGAAMGFILYSVHAQTYAYFPGSGLTARLACVALPLGIAGASYIALCAILRIPDVRIFLSLLKPGK